MTEPIVVFMSSDDEYAPFAATTMVSILEHTEASVKFYVADCGIFADKSAGEIINNSIVSYGETVAQAGTDNKYLLDKLDERHIRSRTETGVLT